MGTQGISKSLDYIKGKDIIIYVLYPGSTNEDLIYETHQLGIFSMPIVNKTEFAQHRISIFRRSQGFYILQEIINRNRIDILEKIQIKSSTGREYTVEKFLSDVSKVDKLL